MSDDRFHRGSGRETRLLVLVVVVSLAVLLVLARFRFPSSDLTVVAPAPGPLAGLAARAAFEDMAATVRTLLTRVTPLMLPVELTPVPPRGRSSVSADASASQFVAALRLQSDLALVPVPTGFQIAATASPHLTLVAADAPRELVVVRVSDDVVEWSQPATDAPVGLQYVGAVSATSGGLTVQPVFIGRLDTLQDPRWPSSILGLGAPASISTPTFLFSIDGRLLGLTHKHANGIGIVPATVLNAVITEIAPHAAMNPNETAPITSQPADPPTTAIAGVGGQ